PAWARGEAPAPVRKGGSLCHGDLHLGQLVRHPAPDGPWLLIDMDDAGVGDPAWDLGRPAAWYAAGLLAP
ncbi:phosphotransferase, partial [Streptomyces sp. SID7982]|nr:phosphotransferase [Streptomyces sp. SID7982]